MKQFLKFTGFAVMSAAIAMGQAATQGQQPQSASGGQNQAAPQAGAPQGAAQPSKQPAAKTKEEYDAYTAIASNPDPAASLTAADEFQTKFANSELKAAAYATVVQKAYNAGANEVTVDASRKTLALQPDHTLALVMLASSLAETTRESDIDSAEKWAEANKSAEKAISTIDKGLPAAAPQLTPEQLAGAKTVLLAMAHSAMGYIALARKDYTEAEKHYKASVADTGDQADPANYLRLAVAQDNLKKYADGIASAKKAAQLADATQNKQVADMARAEQARLEKLNGGK